MDFVLGSKDISVPFNFSIPDKNKLGNKITRVGVWSSGGLDSTALLCLIISELINTKRLDIIEVVALTVIKGEGSTYYSDRIIQKTMNHFGISITHINNLPNNQPGFSEGRVGIVPVRRIYEENKDNMDIYMGINRMAPDNIRPFSQKLQLFYKDEQVLFKAPFLNLHKPQIFDLYYKLGCEDLIQWTHSCTVLPIGECNECYSCMEKKWAFDALGKKYIPTILPDIEDISFGNTWANPLFEKPEIMIYPNNTF